MTDPPAPGDPLPHADPMAPSDPRAPKPPGDPLAPNPPGPSEDGEPRSVTRSIGLGAVAFAATLILLFGLATLVRTSGRAGLATSPPAAAHASSPLGVAGSPSIAPGSPSSGIGSFSASPSGVAASPSAADPVLVGAGDIADCGLDAGSATATLLDGIPGTVFTAGDNAYPDGTLQQFRDCYDPTWGRHRDRTHPAPGNHDWVTKALAGYVGYFGAAAEPSATSWYSYDLGTWHVVVLDSDCEFVGGCGPDSEQGRWLAGDLKGSGSRCTLAIWHHPRFSSGEHGNDTDVAPFWRALYDAGADIVINGHDHDYERFAPQDPNGRADVTRGIREFVVGTGGAELRTFPKVVANSELRATIAHGVIRLVLHQSSYEWTFIPTSGRFSDSGSGQCH